MFDISPDFVLDQEAADAPPMAAAVDFDGTPMVRSAAAAAER